MESWAAQNSVTPRASWFRPRRSADSAHHTLSRIAPYLTANEIRQLQIPFRAVEALLSDRRPSEFEEQWRQRLRPDLNSPLLLPESAFEADPNVRDTWIRAHNVVVDHDNMDAVDVSIRRFVGVHRKGPGWVDARKLLFNKGAPHGEHGLPAWRRQKLGFRLPEGFHFDVNHQRDRSFRLSDQNGIRHQFHTYTNVDPHGFIRGGQ